MELEKGDVWHERREWKNNEKTFGNELGVNPRWEMFFKNYLIIGCLLNDDMPLWVSNDIENNVKDWIYNCYKKILVTMQYIHFSLLWVNGNICYLRWLTLKIWCEGCLIWIWNLYRVAFTLGPKIVYIVLGHYIK
jgi:hypothetical protein